MNDLGVSLHDHGGKTFLDAARALAKVEINPKYLKPDFGWPDKEDSPVLGVRRTIPVFVDEDLSGLLSRTDGDVEFKGTLDEYAKLVRFRLDSHLRQHWVASRPTLFSHSSGYDSRILSQCLAWLRDEGFELGDIHFRCRPPEQDSFLQLMKRQGWKKSQYSVYKFPETDPLDVGAWDRPGVSPWLPVTSQINYWRDIVPYDKEKGWNLIGGSGGGEAVEYPSISKPPTLPWTYCANKPVQRWLSYFPDGTDFAADVEDRFAYVMFPYFGRGHIMSIAELPERFLGMHPSGCDNIRAAVLKTFKDDTLDIPRQPRTYAWSISPERWREMLDRYAASAFVREVPGAPVPGVLIELMMRDFCTKSSNAERIWRLAALWEVIRG